MIQSLPQSIDINGRLFIWSCTLLTTITLLVNGHIDQHTFKTVVLTTTGLVLAGELLNRRGKDG